MGGVGSNRVRTVGVATVGHGGLVGGVGHGGLFGGVGHGGLVGGVGHGGIVSAGPVVSTGVVARPVGVARVGGGQISHQSVHKPLQGENRGVTQSKALGSPVAAVSDHPSTTHGVGSNRVRTDGVATVGHGGHGGHVGGLGHGGLVGHAGVIGGGVVGAVAPVARLMDSPIVESTGV